MNRVLELAENGIGRTNPNPLVGAVIVKDGRIIGEGWHEKYGQAHAEVNAIHNAEVNAIHNAEVNAINLAVSNPAAGVEGATVYVNLEPCCHQGKTPPCTELLIAKGVKRVVIGTLDLNPLVSGKGVEKLRGAGIEVTVGVMEQECKRLNEVFFSFMQKRISNSQPFLIKTYGQAIVAVCLN